MDDQNTSPPGPLEEGKNSQEPGACRHGETGDCLLCLSALQAAPPRPFPETGREALSCRGCYDVIRPSLRPGEKRRLEGERIEILQVDAGPDKGRIPAALLDGLKREIRLKTTPKQALEVFRQTPTPIVILDLPLSLGTGLMQEMRTIHPEVLCLLVDPLCGGEERRLAREAGAFTCINLQEEEDAIKNTLELALDTALVLRDRQVLRERLVVERNRYRSALRHLPMGVVTLAPSLKLIAWNDALASMTGLHETFRGSLAEFLLAVMPEPEHRLMVQQAVDQARRQGGRRATGDLEVVSILDRKLRRVVMQAISVPTEDRAGISLILSFEDVTSERLLALEVVQKARLAAIGEMAACVAHEIKNPLAGITGALDVLLPELPPHQDLVRIRKEIRKQLARLNELAGDLLNYAKPVHVDPVSLPFKDLMRSVMSTLKHHPDFEGSHVELCGGEVLVTADLNQFPEVLQNLLLNATQAGGMGTQVEVCATADGSHVLIRIDDDGPGIPPEKQEQVFAPFFTTRSKGTGLGLPICKKIVEAHGGNLRAESRPGGGTRMEIRLPLQHER